MMRKNAFLKLISLWVLLSVVISPLIPTRVLQAASVPDAKPAHAGMPVSTLTEGSECFREPGSTGPFEACILDDSVSAQTGERLYVLRKSNNQKVYEGDVSAANPSTLFAFPGDTVHIPFSISYIEQQTCPAAALIAGLRLILLPVNTQIAFPVFKTKNGTSTLTFADGVRGPFDANADTFDTLWGYFEYVIKGDEGTSTGGANPRFLMNLQMRSADVPCGAGVTKIAKVDMSNNRQPYRRIEIKGYSAQKVGNPSQVASQSSIRLPFSITNLTSDTNFTYSVSIDPAGTVIPASVVKTELPAGTTSCQTAVTAQITPGIQCEVLLGPIPQGLALSAITVNLTLSGTPNGGGSPIVVVLSWPLTILRPRIGITKVDVPGGTVYPPGSTITYKLTMTNTGGVPLKNFLATDTLYTSPTPLQSVFKGPGGTDCLPTPNFEILPGASCTATYTYVTKTSDPNPLLNTAFVSGDYVPAGGSAVTVTSETTYQVLLEASDLELQFDGPTTPDYVQLSGQLTGQLKLKNTGTTPVTIEAATYQLVNVDNPGTVYATGTLTNVPGSILPGITVGVPTPPKPSYTVPIPPTLPSNVFSVKLVIFVQGRSQNGVVVPRRIERTFDVVRSDLRIRVTSDAVSNIVTRNQTVTYTVSFQNISTGTLTNIKVTGETLNAYPGITSAPIPDLAPGATYDLPTYTYLVKANEASPVLETITATFEPGAKTATGSLSLAISDVKMSLQLIPVCKFVGGSNPDELCSNGGQAITNNEIVVPTIVRYAITINNIGGTRVTNIRACLGLVPTCSTSSPNAVIIDKTALDPFAGTSSGDKGKDYTAAIVGTNATYTEFLSVFVQDQQGKEVVFRTTVTLIILSPNNYITMTKKTSDDKIEFFAGETISYFVKACYDGSLAAADLLNFRAFDAFLGPDETTGLVTLQVTDLNGTPIGSPATKVTLAKNQCAQGTYTVIAQSPTLLTADKVDLINTVIFRTDNVIDAFAGDKAKKSFTVTLKNPLKVTKVANVGGSPVGTTIVPTGSAVSYNYTFENLGPFPIEEIAVTDTIRAKGFYCKVLPTFPTTLAVAGSPGSIVNTACSTFAFGASGESGTTKDSYTNTLDVSVAKVNNGTANKVDVKAQATATVAVLSELTVTKTVNKPVPFIYDPPVIYTVRITNATTVGATYKLIDAEDTLNGILISSGGTTNYSIDGTTLVKFNGGASQALNTVTLAPNDFVTLQYSLRPSDAFARSGDAPTDNIFKVTARLAVAGGTVIPDPNTDPKTEFYKFYVTAKARIIVSGALGGFMCSTGGETYWGWGEKPSFTITVFNGSSVSFPVTINIEYVKINVYGDLVDISGPFTLTQGTSTNFTYVAPKIPWPSTIKSFGGAFFEVRGTYTVNGTNYLGLFQIFNCKDREVGPPVVLTKTPSSPTANIGDTINYVIKAENKTFHTTVSELVLTDTKVGASPIPLSLLPGLTVPRDFLAPGESAQSAPLPYTIQATDPVSVVNIASLNGKTKQDNDPVLPFPVPITAKATVTRPVPLLIVELITVDNNGVPKTAFTAGAEIGYVARVKNNSLTPLKIVSGTTTDATPPVVGATPDDGIAAWKAYRITQGKTDILDPGEIVELYDGNATPKITYKVLSPADAFTQVPPVSQFTSNLEITFDVQSTPVDPGKKATAKATVDLNNPALNVTIQSDRNVAAYNTFIEYTVTVTAPQQLITSLVVTELRPSPNDFASPWSLNGVTDLPGTPTSLDAGSFIRRTVRHLVTTNDLSPVRYEVTATGEYPTGPGQTKTVTDTRVSLVVISDQQLQADVAPLKTSMTAADSNTIRVTYTNIGSLAVNTLAVTITAEDAQGVAVAVPNFGATCVLLPVATDPISKALCSQLAPVQIANPFNQLEVLESTLSTYNFSTPEDPAVFAALPNPLVIKFTASGTTPDGLAFDPVIVKVPIKLQQSPMTIIETPSAPAVTLGGSVIYNIQLQNVSSDPLFVTEIKDNNTGLPVSLKFPGNPTATTTGTLQPGEFALGQTAPVVIKITDTTPYLHTTTAKGTFGTPPVPGQDTSSSIITILQTFVNVAYTPNKTTTTPNTTVDFNLAIQNTGTKPLATLTASANDSSPSNIALFSDPARTVPLTLPLAPNAYAYGRNTVTIAADIRGAYVSTVTVDATDADNNPARSIVNATVNVVGVGLIFTQFPTATPNFGKAGDIIPIAFTVKNTGTVASDTLTAMAATCLGVTCTLDVGFAGTSLAAGATASGTLRYTIQPADFGAKNISIQVSGTQQNTTNVFSVAGLATINVVIGNGLLTKTTPSTQVTAGGTVNYTVALKNVGSTNTLRMISVIDTLKGTITVAPNTDVAPGATQTYTYSYDVPVTASGTLRNTVVATFKDLTTDVTFSAQAEATVSIVAAGANLLVKVTPSVSTAKAGDIITWTTEIENLGTVDVDALSATSSLGIAVGVPPGTILLAGTKQSFSSTNYTIPLTATGVVTNTVTAAGLVASNPTANGIGSGQITIISPQNISVIKTADRQTAKVGDVVTYTVQIKNFGTDNLTVTAVTDTLVTVTIPGLPLTLLPNETKAFNYTRSIIPTDPPGLLRNTVTVTANRPAGTAFSVSANADVIITSGVTGLLITGITNQTGYNNGDTVIYNVTVINTGSLSISGLAAFYKIGTGAEQVITLTTGTLAPNAQTFGTITYPTSAGSPDPLFATLRATGTDTTPATVNASGQTNQIPRLKQLTALFTASPTSVVLAGEVVTYTLSITNTTNPPVSVTITGAAFDSANTNLDAAGYAANVLAALTGVTLAPGASTAPLQFNYMVQAADLGKTGLNAAVDLTYTGGTGSPTNVKANTVAIGQTLKLEVTYDVGTAFTVKPNYQVKGTLKVTNQGTTTLNNLAISMNSVPVFTVVLTPAQQTLAAGAVVNIPFTWVIPTAGINDPFETLAAAFTATGVQAGSGTTVTSTTAPTNFTFINPTLSVSKPILQTVTSPVNDLSTITLKFTITNTSTTNTPISLGAVTDAVKLGLTGVTGAVPFTNGLGTPAFPVTLVSPLAATGTNSVEVTLAYTITATSPNPLEFTISAMGCPGTVVTACNNGTTPATTFVQATSPASDLIAIKRAKLVVAASTANPTTATVGQPVVLSFTLSNTGFADVTNLTTSNVTLNNGTTIAEKVSLGTTTSLAAGQSAAMTLSHTVLATDPTSMTFTFSVSGTSGTAPVSVTFTTSTVTVGGGAVAANGLAIAKTPSVATANNGSAVVFTIVLTNTSTVALQTVAMIDTLPATLTGVSATSDVGTAVLANGAVSASIGTLAAGAKATITINTTVNATGGVVITNQGCATSATNATAICATATVSVGAGTAANPTTNLPVTGFGGGFGGDAFGLFLMLALSALFFLATVRGGRNGGNGNGKTPPVALMVGGVIVGIIAVALVLSIIVGATRRVDSNVKGTQAVAAASTVVAPRTNPPLSTRDVPSVAPTMAPYPTFTPGPTRTPITPTPTKPPKAKLFEPIGERSLYVPNLKLVSAVPIIELPLKNETWDVSTLGQSVGHLEQTSWLGKDGNTVLVAHIQLNFREMGPFKDLGTLKAGDPVMVYDRGSFYMYEVTGAKVVSPTDVQVTYPTVAPQLTLITCTVWDAHRGVFAKRLVVTAKLVMTPDML